MHIHARASNCAYLVGVDVTTVGLALSLLGLGLVGGDLDAVLGSEVGDDDVAQRLHEEGRVGVALDPVHLGAEVGAGDDEVEVVLHLGILADGLGVEGDGAGAALGPAPERSSGRGDLVGGEVVQELLDVVVEELLELEAGPDDALLERVRPLLDEGLADLKEGLGLGVLLGIEGLLEVGAGEVGVDVLGGLLEVSLEVVPRPLQRVLNLVGEVLEGTDGDAARRRGEIRLFCRLRSGAGLGRVLSSPLLWGVPGGSIVLREARYDDLSVPLSPECSALKHR